MLAPAQDDSLHLQSKCKEALRKFLLHQVGPYPWSALLVSQGAQSTIVNIHLQGQVMVSFVASQAAFTAMHRAIAHVASTSRFMPC